MKRRREIRKKRSPSIINKKWRKQQNKIKKSHRREEKREREHKKMKIIKIINKSILQIKRKIKKKSEKSKALFNFFLIKLKKNYFK